MARVRGATGAAVLLLVLSALAVMPADAASRGYSFYATQTRSSEPVRWNPCSPVTYRINPNGFAGPAAIARLRWAVTEVSAASGIRFRYLGRTRHVPDSRTAPVPRSVDADVVIAWARRGDGPRRSALLPKRSGLAGVGGYAAEWTNRRYRIARSGFVVFDAARIFRLSARKQYVVALHELGHLLGLDHVRDRRQVMNPVLAEPGPRHLGAGDRAGLRRVGRAAGCLSPAPRPRTPAVVRDGNRVTVSTRAVRSVSGPVTYALSSPELGGRIARSSTPRFSVSLDRMARRGRAGLPVRFVVRASNRIGYASSPLASYAVPGVRLTAPLSLAVSPTSLDLVVPKAVLAGTTVDVSYLLRIRTQGSVVAWKLRGGTFPTIALYEHILYFGTTITRFDVQGSATAEAPGLDRTYDVSGSYVTSAMPPPPEPEPEPDPTPEPTPEPSPEP